MHTVLKALEIFLQKEFLFGPKSEMYLEYLLSGDYGFAVFPQSVLLSYHSILFMNLTSLLKLNTSTKYSLLSINSTSSFLGSILASILIRIQKNTESKKQISNIEREPLDP